MYTGGFCEALASSDPDDWRLDKIRFDDSEITYDPKVPNVEKGVHQITHQWAMPYHQRGVDFSIPCFAPRNNSIYFEYSEWDLACICTRRDTSPIAGDAWRLGHG